MMQFLIWWKSLSSDFAFGVGVLIFLGLIGGVHLIETVLKLAFGKKS